MKRIIHNREVGEGGMPRALAAIALGTVVTAATAVLLPIEQLRHSHADGMNAVLDHERIIAAVGLGVSYPLTDLPSDVLIGVPLDSGDGRAYLFYGPIDEGRAVRVPLEMADMVFVHP